MKTILTTIFCLQAAFALADINLPKDYQTLAKTRRYCVSRDTTTLEGYVITTWHRDGRPDWVLPSVETNALRRVHGKKQNNPAEVELADAKVKDEKADKVLKAQEKAAEKDAKELSKLIDDVKKKRDKSSEAMAELYSAVLQLLGAE